MRSFKTMVMCGTVLGAVACGASSMSSGGSGASSGAPTPAALSSVTSASTDTSASETLADPGGHFTELCDNNDGDYGKGHDGKGHGGKGHGGNPNADACDKAVSQYKNDEKALRCADAWNTTLASASYKTLVTDVKTLRQQGCNDVIAATSQCQTAITQFDNDLQAFWKSPEFLSLEQTSAYKAVQTDANTLQTLGCFGAGSTTTTTGVAGNTGNTGNGDTAGSTSGGSTTGGSTTGASTGSGTISSTAGNTGNTGNGDTNP